MWGNAHWSKWSTAEKGIVLWLFYLETGSSVWWVLLSCYQCQRKDVWNLWMLLAHLISPSPPFFPCQHFLCAHLPSHLLHSFFILTPPVSSGISIHQSTNPWKLAFSSHFLSTDYYLHTYLDPYLAHVVLCSPVPSVPSQYCSIISFSL